MSTNLGATQLSGGMANPETAVNSATGRLDAAITEITTVDLTADVTLTTTQYQSAFRFDVTPSGTAKKLTLPAVKRMALINNTSANDISVVKGTTTIALAAGDMALFYTDGTTNGLLSLGLASGGGGGGSSQPFDLHLFVPGVLVDGQLCMRLKVTTAFTLPASLTGSYATAGVASTGTVVFTIKQNGTSIGTITFTASATGTLTFASAVTFAVGDLITIEGPATHDTTLADVSLDLLGSR